MKKQPKNVAAAVSVETLSVIPAKKVYNKVGKALKSIFTLNMILLILLILNLGMVGYAVQQIYSAVKYAENIDTKKERLSYL